MPKKQGLYDPQFEHEACGVGFVCDVRGRRTHGIVQQGLEVLRRLSHRGATGADPKTGDGAGVLIQIPHDFFAEVASSSGIDLPPEGEYGTGLVFLPVVGQERVFCQGVFEKIVREEGQTLLGWRDVPLDSSDIGKTALETKPFIAQVFVGKGRAIQEKMALERKLYVIRKRIENAVRASGLKQKSFFYITNLSCRTFSYKGLLTPLQVENFYPDLKDERLKSAICLVHSRYSTNTFPTWDLAQPFRFLAHNGEINTLRGNINWMKARESLLKSELFGDALQDITPIIVPGGSDSASIDNMFELLVLSGRWLPEAMMMLIPAAWEQDRHMDEKLRDFYRYHACFMEPWDGPAAIAFTDGTRVGAVLDRNGLRPARTIITHDDLVVMASEVGVLDIEPQNIKASGRLEPGKMFFIDTEAKRVLSNEEVKTAACEAFPYSEWLRRSMVHLDNIPPAPIGREQREDVLPLLKAFGYTREDLKFIVKPMADGGEEPTGSMGNDTPHAVLSVRPGLLFNYFKQLFAQVTNPPIDPIREDLVMSLDSFIGAQKNIVERTPEHCHKLHVQEPVLTDAELGKIKDIAVNGFRTKTISTLFEVPHEKGFVAAIDRICGEACAAIEDGCSFLVLSDRGVDEGHAALPALLAASAVHQHLIKNFMRTRVGIVVESGEPREVHHFALLFGFGADCVNPYLAYGAVRRLVDQGDLKMSHQAAIKSYRKAVHKGILKILSKMGISTLNGYRGAQIFEALGLSGEVIDKCFAGTVSRIDGAGFNEICKETLLRHQEAYGPGEGCGSSVLSTGGVYQWKRDGEYHLWNPESIALLQDSVRKGDYGLYKKFARCINDQAGHPATLRGLLQFVQGVAVPLEDVEPVEEIVQRFVTGAMSFGSISKGAHETLAIAMNRLKARSNTGEGGEDPARFTPLENGDSKRSAIKQVASGRFGVTTNYLVHADELQIKIAQGAKPGEGGQLPGHKVSVIIAKTRYTTPHVTLISPPPHHDIYSIEDLAQLIFDLKNVNPRARISVKLVSEPGVGTVAAGVAKGHADMILISGGDGGTGASPRSSIMHAGLPWELGLSETHQTLVLNNLRTRVRLQTDGQMRTGRDVAIAALLGAEEYGFCTSALIVLGCVMLRHCNLNNCALGVATQNADLEKNFRGRPEDVVTYFRFVAQELREIMAALGARSINEMIGRTELLAVNRSIIPWKALRIDFSKILYKPDVPRDSEAMEKTGANRGCLVQGATVNPLAQNVGVYCRQKQHHAIEDVLDRTLIEKSQDAVAGRGPVRLEMGIRNTDRTTGAMLSGAICARCGEEGLPEDAVHCKFTGVAGQSFGAFLAKGVTFELEGMANDYVGKGMSGGKLIVYPDRRARYEPDKNIVIGNTTFYGATAGQAYICGVAGERFCIRNSGLAAVVEGVGDHGCEYMTGGRVVVLGGTGRNFAAGMSGGIAYVYDEAKSVQLERSVESKGLSTEANTARSFGFRDKVNLQMVVLERPGKDDEQIIRHLLECHHKYTRSAKAGKVLGAWEDERQKFVKVISVEYKRVLEGVKEYRAAKGVEISDG